MSNDDIEKTLWRAGVPKMFRRRGESLDGSPQRVKVGQWLKNGGVKSLRTGTIAVFKDHTGEGHWAYNLAQVYLTLKKIPTKRFDGWELREISEEHWAALEEARIIFIQGLITRLGVDEETRNTQAFFLRMAIERNIGLCILNDRSNWDQWDCFDEYTENLIRRSIAFVL